MSKPDWACEGSLDEARRQAVLSALDCCNQNVSSAAKRLRVGRTTLYRMLREFHIEHAVPQPELLPLPRPPQPAKSMKYKATPASLGRLITVEGKLYVVR